tara:strand:+ start:351 stop:710 length:360 start_codon:yes stop_codon:yes gene_type:complete
MARPMNYPGGLSEAEFRFNCHKLLLNDDDLERRKKGIKKFIPYSSRLRVFSFGVVPGDWNLGRFVKTPCCSDVRLFWYFPDATTCEICGAEVSKQDLLYEVKNFDMTLYGQALASVVYG